jgi:hypothetical protein
MSIDINLTFDENKLLDKAQLQQSASRQAQLEKEATKGLGAKAARARDKDLTTKNKGGANDSSKPVTYKAPEERRRPAAYRFLPESLLMRPTGTINEVGRLPLKSVGFPLFATSINSGDFEYSTSGGPNNAPTLISVVKPSGSGSSPYFEAAYPYTGSKSKYTLGVENFTLEFFFKFGVTFVGNQNPAQVYASISNGGEITMQFELNTSSNVPYSRLDVSVVEKQGALQRDRLVLANTPYGQVLQAGLWYHVALVKKTKADSSQGSDLYFFINGTLYSSLSVSWTKLLFRAVTDNNWLSFGMGGYEGIYLFPAQPIYMHGLRFLPKAVYTSNFTPPLNL